MKSYLNLSDIRFAIEKQKLTLAHFRGYFPSRLISGNVRTIYGFTEESWIFLDRVLMPESFENKWIKNKAIITLETDKYLRESFKEENLALDVIDKAINKAIPFDSEVSSDNSLDWIELYNLTSPIYRKLLERGIPELEIITP
jgi:hypothetical protein